MEALSEQEIHQLAMDVVGEDLKEKSFEFLTVNSKPKKDPSICLSKR